MNKSKFLEEYEHRLFPLTIPTYDEELIVRYYDAIDVLKQMFDEYKADEIQNEEKYYDFCE